MSAVEYRDILREELRQDPVDRARPVSNESPPEKAASLAGRNWPSELKPEAYHGPAGELVRLIEPHSEADPAALLFQSLVCFGNMIGRTAYFRAEADQHFMNLYCNLVGQTSKGRKGTSFGQVRNTIAAIDPPWHAKRVLGGLSTGEGLIWAVRDPVEEQTPIREKGRVTGYEQVISDLGEPDKRLLVFEPEFARVLKVAERETNTLSAVIRQAFDTGFLRIVTKKQAARATDAHISIIGHITKDELRRTLSDTAVANGFANRFLWVCTRRSKYLPEGGSLDPSSLAPVKDKFAAAASFAQKIGEIVRDERARAIWQAVYRPLSEGRPGMLGAITSRAEALTMRMACVYALLDCSPIIREVHLLAALAAWTYCKDSAAFIFGDALGDATADEIIRALRVRAEGMTRNEIREYFGRNKRSAEIDRALNVLQAYGLARMVQEQTAQGRPPERWYAIDAVNAV